MTWSAQRPCCIECSETESPHRGRGLCGACYQRRLRRDDLPPVEARVRALFRCISCGRDDQRHCARGRCRRCYNLEYMRTYRASEGGAAVIRECRGRYLGNLVHAEQNRSRARLAREREYGIGEILPLGYEDYVLEAFGRCCAACASCAPLELDHHRPLEGGHALFHNAVPLCRSCNARKSAISPDVFYGKWRAAEILVVLHELRERFNERFAPC